MEKSSSATGSKLQAVDAAPRPLPHPKNFRPNSLKTRVTLLVLSVFVIGIWLTAFYASRTMQDDMQRLLGDQQFATVSVVAADINQELDTRLRALKSIAGRITPAMMDHASALQALLQEREVFQQLFNGGSFVTGPDGMSIAAFPFAVERLGVNYAERDFMVAALKGEEVAFGKPVVGRVLGVPTFGMAVPIRNQQGRVIGALVGATNLGLPNFLSHITQSRYGKTGGYVLIAPKHRLVVTATDKTRVMTALPAPGVNPLFDRYLAGFEGSGSVTDSRGLEVLSSAKQIPAAGWLLVARTPTDEAFAPIHEMQRRLLLAASLLTLLTGGLIWWILQRQLAPMLAAVKTLAALSKSDQLPQPLPITHQDEVGELIGGFNGLLETMEQRAAALRESEARYHSLFDNGHAVMLLIDPDGGAIVAANPAAAAFYGWTQEQLQGMRMDQINAISLDQVEAEMQRAQAQRGNSFEFRHRLAAGRVRDVEVFSGPVRVGGQSLLYAIVHDVGARKQAEQALLESRRAATNLMQDAVEARDKAEGFSTTLAQQLDELRRWQQAMLGREGRIMEMKKEVNALLAERGQPPRYVSAVDEGRISEQASP